MILCYSSHAEGICWKISSTVKLLCYYSPCNYDTEMEEILWDHVHPLKLSSTSVHPAYAKWFHSSVQMPPLRGCLLAEQGKPEGWSRQSTRESALGEWARRGAGDAASRQGTVGHRGVQDTEAPLRRPPQSCLSERGGAVGRRQGASSEPPRDFILFLPKQKKTVVK